ncbi:MULTISPECIES: MMPL family transporter [unclassified Corynebacterium]|uniref:MMPL family transporter n=1 Tax=unclassified Corynebacterium TaxID=2624378 RepID=UPI001EF6001C|nr:MULTISPECIES: MMPL family transporter [unclassified Corynebacterium]MCG7234851.1 MMPL family transporter [Corynebacterium sp. ACRPR]MCG7244049.1 MMPL family transporter [Corynebacterium sp. ACRPS]MCG7272574.1 MMPL family transporter [Corynebacterium sp. ACRQM]MDK8474933.1 MMPL family transporter [Corynebacterium sp. MSK078]MDK8659500.1 MMPL family transporter [Corynebacterium sp. MSK204]
MAKLLYRLGRWSFLNKWKVIVTWVVLLAAAGGATALLMKPMTSEFAIKGTPSIDATYKTMDLFPEGGNPANSPSVNLVFQAPEGQKLSDPANEKAINAVISHLEDNLEMGDTMRFGNPLEVSPRLQDEVIHQFTEMGLPESSARADADNLAMVNEDETIAYTTFDFDAESPYSVDQDDKDIVTEAMDIGRQQGLTVEAGGAGFGDEIRVNSTSEVIGLGVAFLVLIFTFGSLVASGMPLISAVIGVGLGACGMLITTHWIELNNMTPVLAIMIGLAVGIDYALFILSRYRAERARMSAPEAAGMAAGTAGSSVVFAGTTVFTALFALLIARIEFLTAMGLSAAATVAIAVLVSLTLIPAMLGLLGDKAFAGRIPGVAGNPSRKGKVRRGPTMGNRWVRLVQKVPGLAMALVVLSLGAMTAPVLHMDLALPADTTSNPDTTQRKAADLMAEGFGPGVNGPFLAVVDAHTINANSAALAPLVAAQDGNDDAEEGSGEAPADSPADSPGDATGPAPEPAPNEAPDQPGEQPADQPGEQLAEHPADQPSEQPAEPDIAPVAEVEDKEEAAAPTSAEDKAALASFLYTADQLKTLGGVKHAQIVSVSEDQRAAQIMVTPETSPTEAATINVAHALRSATKQIEGTTGTEIGLTGLTAVQLDITERLRDAMAPYLSIVVGLAIVLLLVVFRSLLVPLVAGLGFLLSVGGAFGLTVLVWQDGLWGLVPGPGPLLSFMPIFLIGVTFGLAMDYQVFLVTRMREHIARHPKGTSGPYNAVDEATITGFTQGARVVTAAAIIMISVFVAFINQPLPFIQIFGFALAAGVLFDAFFVRMTLVPASMFLMGRATWWMPKWLDKILPTVDIEGTALEEEWEAQHADDGQKTREEEDKE